MKGILFRYIIAYLEIDSLIAFTYIRSLIKHTFPQKYPYNYLDFLAIPSDTDL